MSRIAKWVCSGAAFILGFLTVWRYRRPIPPPVVLSDLQTDTQASTELADAQEDHRETITKIEAEASDVRAGSAGDIASDFDSAFGTVQKVDPFNPRTGDDV